MLLIAMPKVLKHKVNENKICEIRQRIAHVIKSFAALLQALFPTA